MSPRMLSTYLLDNNAFKLVEAGESNITQKINQNAGRVWLSSVAAEEIIVGQMSSLNRARSPRNSLSLVRAHEDFVQTLKDLSDFPVFVYSHEAEALFQTFSPAIIRVGAQDCRIAAQAIAHGMTVVTRNLRDFEAITRNYISSGAPCGDWSAN